MLDWDFHLSEKCRIPKPQYANLIFRPTINNIADTVFAWVAFIQAVVGILGF